MKMLTVLLQECGLIVAFWNCFDYFSRIWAFKNILVTLAAAFQAKSDPVAFPKNKLKYL
jgi:hypothetical protein